MTSDAYTRVLLAILAILLAVLVVQGHSGPANSATPVVEEGDLGRFVVSGIRAGRQGTTLLRTDTKTGAVWKANPQGASRWQLITEPLDLESMEDASVEAESAEEPVAE